VIAAGEACLGYLTPAQRQQLIGNGGESLQLGLYSWTDLTYLLHKHGVSWAYYVQSGIQPDCDDNPDETAAGCAPVAPRRPREREHPRQPGRGLRLQPATQARGPSAHAPEAGTSLDAGVTAAPSWASCARTR
jgi:hypothetical protein